MSESIVNADCVYQVVIVKPENGEYMRCWGLRDTAEEARQVACQYLSWGHRTQVYILPREEYKDMADLDPGPDWASMDNERIFDAPGFPAEIKDWGNHPLVGIWRDSELRSRREARGFQLHEQDPGDPRF